MKNTITMTVASVALLLSLGTFIFQMMSKPFGQGIDKYSFAEPLEAYKSALRMTINKDILAQIQFSAAINDRKLKEKLKTIKVHKVREYGGKTILFVEYDEAGLPKREVKGMEKDSASGFWYEVYVSTYGIEEQNPKLAKEMSEWEKK